MCIGRRCSIFVPITWNALNIDSDVKQKIMRNFEEKSFAVINFLKVRSFVAYELQEARDSSTNDKMNCKLFCALYEVLIRRFNCYFRKHLRALYYAEFCFERFSSGSEK